MAKNLEATIKAEFKSDSGTAHGRSFNVHIVRSSMDPNDLDHLLTGARLQVKMTLEDPNAGQSVMDHGEKQEQNVFESIADCDGPTVRRDKYMFGLKFKDVRADDLARLNFRSGTMTLERIGDAKEDKEDKEPESDED